MSFSEKVLFLSHPKRRIRDTQRYKGFRSLFNGGLPSLKALVDKVLGLKIQTGAHDSVRPSLFESFQVILRECLGRRCSCDNAIVCSTSSGMGKIST